MLTHPSEFPLDGTFLNAAYSHPVPARSVEAVRRYFQYRSSRTRDTSAMGQSCRMSAIYKFAALINADPDEVMLIGSTMVGENLVAHGLGLGEGRARVVTDALHYGGSLYLYAELAKKGVDLVVVPAHDHRIDLADLDKAISPNTRLVALSLVSMFNGFEHDLKAVCYLAHSRGALVYADIVQAAGAVPIDVKASGVDFCACSSYKWLMGDFGLAFFYVRRDRLPGMRRSFLGKAQLARFDYPVSMSSFDKPVVQDFDVRQDMIGHFGVGTVATPTAAVLDASLDLISQLGIEAIKQHRIPMLRRLQETLPEKGFTPLTPQDSTSPIVAFAYPHAAARLAPKLAAAGINIQCYDHRVRISPSVYNTMDHVEMLIDALPATA